MRLYAGVASDGMTIDNEGNVYLTQYDVLVYDSAGRLIETIDTPEAPTNLSFGGSDNGTLFITTRTGLYSIGVRGNS
jgi:gluconolactonase